MPKHQQSRTYLGLICLLLFVGHTLADDPVSVTEYFKIHEATVTKEKHFVLELSDTQINEIESKEESLFITVEALEGDGMWTISGKDPRSEDNQVLLKKSEGTFIHNNSDIVGIGIDSEIWSEAKIGKKVYLTVKNTGTEENPIKLAYVAESSAFVDAAVGTHNRIHVKHLTSLKLRTKITKAEGNHHYKFMLDALQHGHNRSLSAEVIKHSTSGAKSDAHKLLKFEQDRIGIVVSPDDSALYCQDTSCDYEISVSLSNIRILDFYIGEHIDFELMSDGQSTVNYFFNSDWIHQRIIPKRKCV